MITRLPLLAVVAWESPPSSTATLKGEFNQRRIRVHQGSQPISPSWPVTETLFVFDFMGTSTQEKVGASQADGLYGS